ncbi:hypothetical protein BAU15_02860 [Enterococcus sp. JM4C]|uniref:hypothetical protein n=1 Tax=Candidatus Enterococcus huntleyi TaxID=1857217 RepID=UPI00137B75BE|nr:hypothetical protein [Enterococcus sp. JM4C]KAF1299601.1 hypothetical protein BAU15_02860 [Enterococcus sp. JM4C]
MFEIQVSATCISTNKVSIKNNTDTKKLIQLLEKGKLLKIIFLEAYETKTFLFDELAREQLEVKEIS